MPKELPATDRTRVRRKADRARYDRATVDAILDEGLVAHVGFAAGGRPCVLPMAYVRVLDHVYLHGAAGNHALRTLAAGAEACVTVTLLDALVLSRSAFHHSVNYRSVVVFGNATKVDDVDEKRASLMALVEHMVPGRGAHTRGPSDAELRQTLVVRLPLLEGSAKVRTGPPIEEPEDLGLPYWGGELPLTVHAAAARPDAHTNGVAVPEHVRHWTRAAAGFAAESGSIHSAP